MDARRVLVIDDEEVVQEVVQGCLEDVAGWQVWTASTGRQGLEIALSKKLDGIVLDVMMPGMDGITFLHHLRADAETVSIPVILLTARVDLTDLDQLATLGVRGAIAKPFDPMCLADQVAEFLDWDLEES